MAALTLREILTLDTVREAAPEVLAGASALDHPVRWVHSSEVYEAVSFLDGGELLLTNGFGIRTADAETRRAYVRELAARGVAGVAVEVGRGLAAMPEEIVAESRRLGLPLIALHRVVPFVRITQAANTVIVTRLLTAATRHHPPGGDAAAALLADLAEGRALNQPEVTARSALAGFRPPAGHRLVGVCLHGPAAAARGVLDGAVRALGFGGVLRAAFPGDTLALLAVPPPERGGEAVRAVRAALAQAAAGVKGGSTAPSGMTAPSATMAPSGSPAPARITAALGHSIPAGGGWLRWSETLRAARETLELALTVPDPEPATAPAEPATDGDRTPRIVSAGALALERELTRGGLEANRARLARLADDALGPLVAWDAAHPSDLVRTLEVHLRHGCSPTRTAALLHIGRQSLYQRLERIESLLGVPVTDPEQHTAFLVAACAHRILAGASEASVAAVTPLPSSGLSAA
ncbi:PucR family transcriptional regulator [Streptomyces sp. A7024]|uniref:PucR family transcriptional regulator n=1 Tax=Streptomyces coryli TaxID=1128680 RepID=A0A6G4TUY2_9ACTN|nr:PucR family transcriptional regulator [Streptomyces coryli]NGN63694.1 PucR family transcriptional regulator [Streptomyces coryli]